METGAITQYFDVAQLVLYAFWIFFAGLIYYLHQENKREGYPLESGTTGRNDIGGFPSPPAPKTFRLADGTTVTVPRPTGSERMPIDVAAIGGESAGTPLEPTGDGMGAGIGPGAYAQRRDVPDTTIDGKPRIGPLRAASDITVAKQDIDPRGLDVMGSDLIIAGVVRDLWVDRSEIVFRYLEVEIAGAGAAGSAKTVLLPFNFSRIGARGVLVDSILGRHFAGVPRTKEADRVTLLEEEKIMAYYGSGTLYAHPGRAEPLL